MTTVGQRPASSKQAAPRKISALQVALGLGALAFVLVVALAMQAAQISGVRSDLDSARDEASLEQIRGDAYKEALAQAYTGSSQTPPKPVPQVVQHGSHVSTVGFLGWGGRKIVISAQITNTGAPGVVRFTGIAVWPGGTSSRDTEVFLATGQQRRVEVTVSDVPKGSGHQVSIAAAE